MQVRAIKPGYYNMKRRGSGKWKDETFELSDPAHFSKTWMVKIGGSDPVPVPAPALAMLPATAPTDLQKARPGRPRKS
jgi:hypothetical protein